MEDLDKLAILELGLRVLILGQARVDVDMHHSPAGIAETGICGAPDINHLRMTKTANRGSLLKNIGDVSLALPM
jgi:hypothetical protein